MAAVIVYAALVVPLLRAGMVQVTAVDGEVDKLPEEMDQLVENPVDMLEVVTELFVQYVADGALLMTGVL